MAENERTDWPVWMRDLGRQLRHVREFLGLSQEQVARLAGVSQGAVSRLEAGRGLATPLLIVLKVHLVLTRALSGLDPDIMDDEMRAGMHLGGLVPPTPGADALGRITKDPELDELVQLYRSVPERQRRTLVAVLRATARSLSRPTSVEADATAEPERNPLKA